MTVLLQLSNIFHVFIYTMCTRRALQESSHVGKCKHGAQSIMLLGLHPWVWESDYV